MYIGVPILLTLENRATRIVAVIRLLVVIIEIENRLWICHEDLYRPQNRYQI